MQHNNIEIKHNPAVMAHTYPYNRILSELLFESAESLRQRKTNTDCEAFKKEQLLVIIGCQLIHITNNILVTEGAYHLQKVSRKTSQEVKWNMTILSRSSGNFLGAT